MKYLVDIFICEKSFHCVSSMEIDKFHGLSPILIDFPKMFDIVAYHKNKRHLLMALLLIILFSRFYLTFVI